MPWSPLPRIAFAVATHPFNPTTRDDLPLELGDELYIIEQCADGQWFRGYLVAPPSLLAGLTSTKGATLEARVFSGIFPACCVDVKEYLSTEVPLLPEDAAELEAGDDEDGDGGSVRSETGTISAAARNLKRTRSRRKRNSIIRASAGRERDLPRSRDRPRPAAPVPMLKVGDETSSYENEPLVDEIASCLREWHAANLHELLLNRQYPLLDEISTLVQQLDLSRRQLINDVLTRAELNRTREETVWRLVRGNKLLSREIIVREPASGRILTGDDSSVGITKLQSVMSLLEEPPRQSLSDGTRLYHLMLDYKGFVGVSNEPTTIVLYLANRSNIAVSETFTIELTAKGLPVDTSQIGRLQALFTDISARDADDLYLIARVYTNIGIMPGPQAMGHTKGQGSDGSDGRFGATIKARVNSNRTASPPSSDQQKLRKGRVSVLFSPRPKTAGKEGEETKGHSRNGVTSSHSSKENRPPSNSSVPLVPPMPTKRAVYKKALGVGVLDVGKFIKQDQATEQIMRIFVPSSRQTNGTEKSAGMHLPGEKGGGTGHNAKPMVDDWDRLVRDVIDTRTKQSAIPDALMGMSYRQSTGPDMRLAGEKSQKADRLHLYLRPFAADDADDLVKSMPTIFHHTAPVRKIGFSGAPKKSRSDIYITLGGTTLPKHGMLIHPKLGTCQLPPPSQFNLLQVNMEVKKSNGDSIRNCIFPAANLGGQTVWRSSLVAREESWSQTVRFVLDDDDVPDAHVFMTVAGVPNAPAAMAWFPLWDEGAFLKDGEHEIALNKYDEHTATPRGVAADSGYLIQPWTTDFDEGWAGALSMSGAAASIKVKSYLCSTHFSQDDVLLSLLRWKELSHDELMEVLKKAVFVPEMEIVKLLREVFDALFEILVEHASKADVEDLVFNALVTVLGIVYDRRFNLEPIVDEYAVKHFDYPFATPCLLRSFTRLLQDPAHQESSVKLRAAFKVGKHIFRFIVHAREKHEIKEANIGINGTPMFSKDLRGIFKLLESLMQSTDARLVGSQTLAVQHFHQWLPELVGVLSREDILLIAIDFMDACADVRGKLVLYKLVLIVNYSSSSLFSQPEDRRALTLNTVRWLEPHWGRTDHVTDQWRDQVRLCCSVLDEQVEELGEEVSDYIPKIVSSYRCIQASGSTEKDTFSLLFPKAYPFQSKPVAGKPVVFDETLIELSAILAAVSSIPTGIHLDLSEEELADFLMEALKVHMSILSCEAFPADWLSVHIYQHRSTMRTLETLAGILVDSFLPDPDDAERFNTDLWQVFFSTLLMLVGSGALALETFPEQKRRAVWKVAGDVREQGADLLRRTWEAIGWETSIEDKRRFGIEKMGGYQVQYVPGLVGPIVELCLSVHEGLRSVAVEVLQTMVVSEWTLSQDLSVIQAEMIDSLDRLFKGRRSTESITQKLFIADLIELFRPLSELPEDPLATTVDGLLQTVDEFLDLLVAVHNTPLGETYQIMDTLRLMDFLKDMRKEDMFIRYVHQLVGVQINSNNLVEAGLSLKLHADLYRWDPNEKVPALDDPKFPEQTAFERREQLFLEMIKYFEDGHSWENALDTYRELAENYENVVFEFGKLAKCHRAMAALQDEVVSGQRAEPRYYCVAYYGMGFPLGLRDRQFIVQAGPFEGLSEFCDRMQQMHPSAKLVDGEVDSVEGQFVHVISVIPEVNYSHPVFRKTRVAANIRDYLARRDVRTFCTPPLPQVEPGTWTEKTVFITGEGFPAILKSSEVLQHATVAVSPVELAIEEVLKRTKELAEFEYSFTEIKATAENRPELTPLNMALTHAVDGKKSVAPLRELQDEPDTKEEVREALKTVMMDHVAVVKRVLIMHARLVPPALEGVRDMLGRCFEQTFYTELAAMDAVPKLPTSPGQWRSAPSPGAVGHSRDSSRSQPTPVPQRTASARINGFGHSRKDGSSTTILSPPPPTSYSEKEKKRVIEEAEQGVVTSARGRLTSMIFGQKEQPVQLHHPPPPPTPKEDEDLKQMRSRSDSVSTGRSAGKSFKAASGRIWGHSFDRERPNTENGSVASFSTDGGAAVSVSTRGSNSEDVGSDRGGMERGGVVSSVKRRWSRLTLGRSGSSVSGKGNKNGKEGWSDVGSLAEEEE